MKDLFLDVRLELSPEELMRPDPDRYVIEKARAAADKLCDEHGALLSTDPPEIIVTRGVHKITRNEMVLIATRWKCRVPHGAPIGPPEQR